MGGKYYLASYFEFGCSIFNNHLKYIIKVSRREDLPKGVTIYPNSCLFAPVLCEKQEYSHQLIQKKKKKILIFFFFIMTHSVMLFFLIGISLIFQSDATSTIHAKYSIWLRIGSSVTVSYLALIIYSNVGLYN